jgi:hypothetical protein
MNIYTEKQIQREVYRLSRRLNRMEKISERLGRKRFLKGHSMKINLVSLPREQLVSL